MPLEPECQILVDALAAMPVVDPDTVPVDQHRETIRMLFTAGDAPDVPWISATVAGLAARVYDPPGSAPDGPTVVWYHGGGFVIGDLETTDGTCRRLAAASGMRLVSVDYRLAPESPFPAAVDDCYAAYVGVASGELGGQGGLGGGGLGGPPAWIAVGGDSAGGNLAAVTCLVARDRGGRLPDFQLLVYPVTHLGSDTASRRENGKGYLLTGMMMDWFEEQYLGAGGSENPYASPLVASSLAGLPPAHVVTAEFDPLRDEGEAYAARLRAAGVAVEAVRYDGQLHGFFGTPHVFGPTAQTAVESAARSLKTSAAG